MSAEESGVTGPDLSQGVPVTSIPEGGMLGGHVGTAPVILSRDGDSVYAIGGSCTHYGGPLVEGLVVGRTVRCPWHHACFDLQTGEATCAPALNPVSRWTVERDGALVKVTGEVPAPDGATPLERTTSSQHPSSVVIIGAGAAGNAAAEMLRRNGYRGKLTMIGRDPSVPYDRPNLSKDYLAGNAPEEWIPLRPDEFYSQHDIELIKDVEATEIDTGQRLVQLSNGETRKYDKLLLATGADPVRLPGTDLPNVYYLRTLADSRAIIAAADNAKSAVVIGASFIGLEVAASLRTRGLSVDVVAPEKLPLERVLGAELGAFIQKRHEDEGVRFHLGRTSKTVDANGVTLDDGSTLSSDIVVIGVGVRPLTALAEKAGLAMDKGVVVNEYLETSSPGIFAAGDIARCPDPRSGENVRIEHWVVAERQGQTAARNILGMQEKFDTVPFFWSNHYSTPISYVGHAEKWDEILIDGNLDEGEAVIGYRLNGKILAVAATAREKQSLEAEAAMERFDWKALDEIFNGTKAT